MITSISSRVNVNNASKKQQTAQQKQITFSATPAEIATVRFDRLPGMAHLRTLCVDGDHTLGVLLEKIFEVGAALKPGEKFSLIKGTENPKGTVFKFLDRLLDRKYGQNPYKTLRDGLLKRLKDHNELDPSAAKLLNASKIKDIFTIEAHKAGEPRTLTEFMKKLEADKKLLPVDNYKVQNLLGYEFENIPNKDVFRIPH